MATQGPPKLSPESPLVTNDTTSNVAVNQQVSKDLRAANVDGKDIRPSRIFAKDMNLETALTVGNGVQLTDGCVSADNLASDSVTTDKIATDAVTANEISVTSLSSLSANLGSISAGDISVASGQVSIGSASSGIGIIGNVFTMVSGGVAKVTINGNTGTATFSGEVSASKITISENVSSSAVFGCNITLSSGNYERYVYFQGTDQYVHGSGGGSMTMRAASSAAIVGGTSSVAIGGSPATFTIAGATNFSVNSTGNLSMSGIIDSNGTGTNYFAGTIVVENTSGTSEFAGDVRVASGKVLKAKHACQDGTSAKADATFSYYVAETSGGAVTKKHTVTFKDGLITSWA